MFLSFCRTTCVTGCKEVENATSETCFLRYSTYYLNVEGSDVVTKSSLNNLNGNDFISSKDVLCDAIGGDKDKLQVVISQDNGNEITH